MGNSSFRFIQSKNCFEATLNNTKSNEKHLMFRVHVTSLWLAALIVVELEACSPIPIIIPTSSSKPRALAKPPPKNTFLDYVKDAKTETWIIGLTGAVILILLCVCVCNHHKIRRVRKQRQQLRMERAEGAALLAQSRSSAAAAVGSLPASKKVYRKPFNNEEPPSQLPKRQFVDDHRINSTVRNELFRSKQSYDELSHAVCYASHANVVLHDRKRKHDDQVLEANSGKSPFDATVAADLEAEYKEENRKHDNQASAANTGKSTCDVTVVAPVGAEYKEEENGDQVSEANTGENTCGATFAPVRAEVTAQSVCLASSPLSTRRVAVMDNEVQLQARKQLKKSPKPDPKLLPTMYEADLIN